MPKKKNQATVFYCFILGGIVIFLSITSPLAKNFFIQQSFNSQITAPKVKNYISRVEEDPIESIITPSSDVRAYYLITGEPGTGKTTLVRHVAHRIGKGIIYVTVPPKGEGLGAALAIAMGLDERSFWIKIYSGITEYFGSKIERPQYVVRDVLNRLEVVAQNIKDEDEKPVLIFDEINNLAVYDPLTLDYLQDKARTWVTENLIKVVFVTSEGTAVSYLQARPAATRMALTIIEVGDISFSEAKRYLLNGTRYATDNFTKEMINCAVDTVIGGRFLYLSQIQVKLQQSKSSHDLLQQLTQDLKSHITSTAQQFIKSSFKSNPQAVDYIFQILQTPERQMLRSLFMHDDLLKPNVFALHPHIRRVSLQSRAMELYLCSNVMNYGILRQMLEKNVWCEEFRQIHESCLDWPVGRFDEELLLFKRNQGKKDDFKETPPA